jgi:GH35 family endo-1,4-beta-xylanase
MKKNINIVLILLFFLTACSAVTTTPLAPTKTPQFLESTSTGIPTLSPSATPTEMPTPPMESLSVTQQSVNELANAMQNAGVSVPKEQLLQQGIQIQTVTGVDGKQYEMATIHLDPDPTQQGESLEGNYPLMVKAEKGWEQATLKALANMNEVKIGVYVGSYGVEKDWQLRDQIQEREFNAGFVASSWNSIQTGKGVINFPISLDQDATIARSAGMEEIYFHLMTWFMQTPGYLRSLSNEEVGSEVGAYIRDYVTKYSSTTGEHSVFNVVNEAFYTYNGGDVLKQKLGEDYVTFLFREAAKAAKPGDTLVYSDYGIIPRSSSNEVRNDEKIHKIINSLLNDLEIKASGVNIGLGMQVSLIGGNDLTSEEIAKIIDSYGVPVYLTEVDVLIGNDTSITRLMNQSREYETIIKGVLLSKNCKSVYIFGTDDASSWYERQPDLADYSPNANPLLFDDNFAKKASYYGVMQALFENLLKQ